MGEPQVVIFEDQTHRRRKLQLHNVDGQLRVNLNTALANYDAVSFSRTDDGLILENYKGSEYSTLAFSPGQVVSIETVRRNADHAHLVKSLLEELDKRGAVGGVTVDAIVRGLVAELGPRPEERLGQLMRAQYQEPGGAQPMQQDATPQHLTATSVDLNQPTTDGMAHDHTGQLGAAMHLAMTPQPASPAVSELNASGKKRRFCGACQNHNVRTPVTFQHQQTCQWRNCPCSLCIKKRNISQAQAQKRHAAKQAAAVAAGAAVGVSNGMQVDHLAPEPHQEQHHEQHVDVQDHLPPQSAPLAVAPPSPSQLALPVPDTTA